MRRHRNARRLHSEQLEARRALAADLAAMDVNHDARISPVDALIVINAINLPSGAAVTVTGAESEAEFDCDTNRDGAVTPQDVLGIINLINSGVVDVPAAADDTPASEVPTPDQQPEDDVNSSPGDETSNDDTPPSNDNDDNSSDDDTQSPGDDDSLPDDDPQGDDDTGDDDTGDDDTGDDDTGGDNSGDDSDDESADDDLPGDDEDDDSSNDDDDAVDEVDCEKDRPQPAARLPMGGGVRKLAERMGREHRGDRPLFRAFDANEDGKLTSDEVPEAIWTRISAADTDKDSAVSKDELNAYRQAQRLAAVEAFFERLDSDDSGAITSSEVPRLAWRILSRADSDTDGKVTLEEFVAAMIRR